MSSDLLKKFAECANIRVMEKNKGVYIKAVVGVISALTYFDTVAAVMLYGVNNGLRGSFADVVVLVASMILTLWCVYIDYRIQLDNVRKLTRIIYSVGCVWIMLRYFRNLPVFSEETSRYLGYFYYVPLILISFLFFVLFFEVFFGKFRGKKLIYIALGCLTAAVISAVLTNEFHFRFIFFPGGVENIEYYRHGTIYYIMLGYCYALFLSGIVVFIIGTARRNNYAQIISPIIVLAAFLFYLLYYTIYYDRIVYVPVVNDSIVVGLLFIAGLLEVCMQCGLIQNRGRYIEYLDKSMLPVCITAEDGTAIYKSRGFNIDRYRVGTNPDFRFDEMEISGGKIIIEEDLTQIHYLRKQAEKQNARLKQSNALLAKSRELIKEQASLKARRELYDEIESAVALKIEEIESLAGSLPDELNAENAESVRKELSAIRLRIGYLKQKSMLVLLARTADCLSESQFRMMSDVIKTDVRSAGMFSVAFNVICKNAVSVQYALAFNDFVEYIAEAFSFTNAALFITVNADKDICVAGIETEIKPERLNEKSFPRESGYIIECKSEDNEYRIVMRKERVA